MASVASFAHIDIAPFECERIEWFDSGRGLDNRTLKIERHDFNQTADADYECNQYAHEPDAFFDDFVIHALLLIALVRSSTRLADSSCRLCCGGRDRGRLCAARS